MIDDSATAKRIVSDAARAMELLESASRVAVLGAKPEEKSFEPAYYVPRYLQDVGYEVVPVPVYYPDARTMLGEKTYRSLAEIPDPVDIVLVFRRPVDVPAHLDDFLAARPGTVWMQSGIRHEEIALRLARAGINVVQDRCAMIDHRRLRARARTDRSV